jgi:transcriptional regulator NrdR family protein
MRCPVCDSKTRVIESEPSGPRGEVRRRRACMNQPCGHRFSTLEILIKGHTPINPLEISKEPSGK